MLLIYLLLVEVCTSFYFIPIDSETSLQIKLSPYGPAIKFEGYSLQTYEHWFYVCCNSTLCLYDFVDEPVDLTIERKWAFLGLAMFLLAFIICYHGWLCYKAICRAVTKRLAAQK